MWQGGSGSNGKGENNNTGLSWNATVVDGNGIKHGTVSSGHKVHYVDVDVLIITTPGKEP